MTQPRIALCLEQTLGHRAHGLNIEAAVAADPEGLSVLRIDYRERGRLPEPWALRGSRAAWSAIRRLDRRPDLAVFHTSTISLMAPASGAASGYAVSLDATPLQVDTMGAWYAHEPGPRVLEATKRRWYRRVFGGASRLVAWSEWAAGSLVRDYGVDRARILVAHPGAAAEFFEIPRPTLRARPRIVFVGGDFVRKGGDVLLEAFAPLAERAELVLVTEAEVPAAPGMTQLRGVRPGTPELLAAYGEADIFCLPTRGDCTSVAIGEAMAAGLPVVTTPVGSNADTVTDSETGLLVETGSVAALHEALHRLVDDAGERRRMGAAARADALDRMHAAHNARRILDMLRSAA